MNDHLLLYIRHELGNYSHLPQRPVQGYLTRGFSFGGGNSQDRIPLIDKSIKIHKSPSDTDKAKYIAEDALNNNRQIRRDSVTGIE